jgi:hypothetical protein
MFDIKYAHVKTGNIITFPVFLNAADREVM